MFILCHIVIHFLWLLSGAWHAEKICEENLWFLHKICELFFAWLWWLRLHCPWSVLNIFLAFVEFPISGIFGSQSKKKRNWNPRPTFCLCIHLSIDPFSFQKAVQLFDWYSISRGCHTLSFWAGSLLYEFSLESSLIWN